MSKTTEQKKPRKWTTKEKFAIYGLPLVPCLMIAGIVFACLEQCRQINECEAKGGILYKHIGCAKMEQIK